RSRSVASIPASARARCAATTARSEVAVSASATRRSRMPVREVIHSSLVSTLCAISALVTIRSGTHIPRPKIPARRRSLTGATYPAGAETFVGLSVIPIYFHEGTALYGRRGRIADALAYRFDDLVLDGALGGAAGIGNSVGVGAPMPDDADAVDAQERRASAL